MSFYYMYYTDYDKNNGAILRSIQTGGSQVSLLSDVFTIFLKPFILILHNI